MIDVNAHHAIRDSWGRETGGAGLFPERRDDDADETPSFRLRLWKRGSPGVSRAGSGRNETVDFGFTSELRSVADTVQGPVGEARHLHEVVGGSA